MRPTPDHSATIAVITGGSQGLGLAIAEHLLATGCRQTIIAGRAVAKGETVAERLRAGGADVRFLPADMENPQDAINCGWMDTPGEDKAQRKYHGAGADWLHKAEAAQPMGMLVKPAHVAGLASYMLSDASGVMTGAVVDFDQNVSGAYPE